MATNAPTRDNHRKAAVKSRSQVLDQKNKLFTKRNADSGEFMDQKENEKPFKGVRKGNN